MYDRDKSLLAADLLRKCIGMQDFSRIVHICHYALMANSIPGDIVELGCYVGDTAKILAHITGKNVFVYDSFEGLPDDETNNKARMNEATQKKLIDNFRKDGIKYPTMKKCWFNELTPNDLPEQIAFAHLDGDLYSSIMDSLNLVYSRMSVGGVILVDDYCDPEWPGAEAAVNEFFSDKPEEVIALPGMNHELSYKALIVKQ